MICTKENTLISILGKKLKEHSDRKKSNYLTQQDLAKKSGLTQGSISKVLNGKMLRMSADITTKALYKLGYDVKVTRRTNTTKEE